MTAVQFCYWLQGFFELNESPKALSPEQVHSIKNHLSLVFLHEIDPSYSDNKVVQTIFQNIHDGKDPLDGLNVTHKSPQPQRPSNTSGHILKC